MVSNALMAFPNLVGAISLSSIGYGARFSTALPSCVPLCAFATAASSALFWARCRSIPHSWRQRGQRYPSRRRYSNVEMDERKIAKAPVSAKNTGPSLSHARSCNKSRGSPCCGSKKSHVATRANALGSAHGKSSFAQMLLRISDISSLAQGMSPATNFGMTGPPISAA